MKRFFSHISHIKVTCDCDQRNQYCKGFECRGHIVTRNIELIINYILLYIIMNTRKYINSHIYLQKHVTDVTGATSKGFRRFLM
jgi:hypothetical protein